MVMGQALWMTISLLGAWMAICRVMDWLDDAAAQWWVRDLANKLKADKNRPT